MHRKAFLLFLIHIFFFNKIALTQTINKYNYLHLNRKNDSLISNSPLSSGYNNTESIEFSFEPIPTKAMKEKTKVLNDLINVNVEENEENELEKILGSSDIDDFSYGDQSTIIQELDAEVDQAIIKQQIEEEKIKKTKRKNNIASYTASVEAKKKRNEIAQKNNDMNYIPPKEEILEEGEEEKDESNTFEIFADKDGKIKLKSPSTTENKYSPPIASSTLK